MDDVWQVQEAKARFGEVIDKALREGPQTVTRHGKAVVKVMAISDAKALDPASDGFAQFLLSGPRIEGGIPLPKRSRSRRPIPFADE